MPIRGIVIIRQNGVIDLKVSKIVDIPTKFRLKLKEDDLDMKDAYHVFFGKTNDAMQKEFKNNCIERCIDLRHMSFVAFKYYIFGLKQYIDMGDFGPFNKPDAASCFIELIYERLISDSGSMELIIKDLMPTIEIITKNQAAFEADVDIYGSFEEIFIAY